MLEDRKDGPGQDPGANDSLPDPIRPIFHTEGKNPNITREITGQGKPSDATDKGE